MATSATDEDKNHKSADGCNSGFRTISLIWIHFTVVQMPPPNRVYGSWSDDKGYSRTLYTPRERTTSNTTKAGVQYFFVRIFILQAKNSWIGVEAAN